MDKDTFTIPLLNWYQLNKRNLPFRQTSDPYKIWVSEIMAQQTQIATMLPYYKAWIHKWPTIKDLANAQEIEVKKLWQGLGYYRRASNLLKGAKFIVDYHNGDFPTNPIEIAEIPGVGEYTTGAIASIAFNKPVPAIDGNVIRVMSRVMSDSRDFKRVANKRDLTEELTYLMQGVPAGDFTQALMECGALVCKPQNPDCQVCPLNKVCTAYRDDTVDQFPLVMKKKPVPILNLVTYVITRDNQLLVDFDSNDGLMEGLARLPQLPKDEAQTDGLDFMFNRKHTFSHLKWHMDVYYGSSLPIDNHNWSWLHVHDIDNYPWANAHLKIIKKLIHK